MPQVTPRPNRVGRGGSFAGAGEHPCHTATCGKYSAAGLAAGWRYAVDARHGQWWRDGLWWDAEYAWRSGWRRHVRSVVQSAHRWLRWDAWCGRRIAGCGWGAGLCWRGLSCGCVFAWVVDGRRDRRGNAGDCRRPLRRVHPRLCRRGVLLRLRPRLAAASLRRPPSRAWLPRRLQRPLPGLEWVAPHR